MLTFKLNDYITLKLESKKTNIYIKGIKFRQCKYLLLNIPCNEVTSFEDIISIDEAVKALDDQMEFREGNVSIPPETEFWAHCSNLQVWAENNYNTRLLLSNLAFPLLKRLTEAGDVIAQRVFKDEIIERFLCQDLKVVQFLVEEGYLRKFEVEEVEVIIDQLNLEKMPNDKAVSYLEILGSSNLNTCLLKDHVRRLGLKMSNLSGSEVLELINKDLTYNSVASNFYELLLRDSNFSKIFFASINSDQYDLQNKIIHFLSYIKGIGPHYLAKWFPLTLKSFNSVNFKSALFELSIHCIFANSHFKVFEFIKSQIYLWQEHSLINYNKLVEILDGLKLLYGISLVKDIIEISTDKFFFKFDRFYGNDHIYIFHASDTICKFSVQAQGVCYYKDLIQERLPDNEFFRGKEDAHREVKKVLFPENSYIATGITSSSEDLPFRISVSLLDLTKKSKSWIKKIKSNIINSDIKTIQMNLVKNLELLVLDILSDDERLSILYHVLDYIIYEIFPIEIRFINRKDFTQIVKDYFKKLDKLVISEDKIINNDSFEDSTLLSICKTIFFPDESIEIVNIFKLESYVFYVKFI